MLDFAPNLPTLPFDISSPHLTPTSLSLSLSLLDHLSLLECRLRSFHRQPSDNLQLVEKQDAQIGPQIGCIHDQPMAYRRQANYLLGLVRTRSTPEFPIPFTPQYTHLSQAETLRPVPYSLIVIR